MAWGLATVGAGLSGLAQIKSAPGQWKVATRATAMTAITVGVVWLALGKELALLAITGSFIGNTASARPWRARLHILAWMDLAYIAGCAIAVVIGSNPVLLTLTLTAIAMTAVLGYNAVMADPPGPMFLIIGPAIASYLPTVGVDKWQVIAVCVLSCLTASIATLALHPRADSAEAQAVDAAREAVEELIEQAAQPDTTDLEIAHLRDTAYAQVLSASMTLEEAAGRNARASAWRSLLVDLRRLHFQVIAQVASRSLPGAVVEVDAAAQRRYLGAPPVKYLLRWALSSIAALARVPPNRDGDRLDLRGVVRSRAAPPVLGGDDHGPGDVAGHRSALTHPPRSASDDRDGGRHRRIRGSAPP